MSSRSARHRKPSRFSATRKTTAIRQRHAPLTAPARRYRLAAAGATVAGSALILTTWTATANWTGGVTTAAMAKSGGLRTLLAEVRDLPQPGGPTGSGPLSTPRPATPARSAGAGRSTIRPRRAAASPAGVPAKAAPQASPVHAEQPVYANPLRSVSGLIPERIDMGVDFGGSGPVYALGDGVVTNATASNAGWPGGGWITYQLTAGPDKGLTVYLAEDVTPAVQVGQHVTSGTVIATMFDGGDGIETGWAQPDGSSAESQLPVAGGISGNGPFPTMIGLNFEELLQSVGVPAANNRYDTAYGVLPGNYPAG